MTPRTYFRKIAATVLACCLYSFQAVWGQLPAANFTASPLAGCSPLVVNFQDLSSGNPTAWSWNFGNGNTSSLKNPVATYFTPGTYTVTLTVTNANGKNTLTRSQYITVYASPSVNFGALQTSGCFPLKTQFSDSSSAGSGNNIASWLWDFGDGTTSNLENPLHTYTTAGNFTIILKVTNDKGCTKVLSKPNFVKVTPGVLAGFTNTQPVVCRPPATIAFTNTTTGSGALTYNWDFGDGNSSVQKSPLNTYNTAGTYTVTLIATSSNGCADTIVKNNLLAIGTNSNSFSSADSICVNDSIRFTNTSSPAPGGATWNFGDGTTSTQFNPTHTYTAPGNYVVKLINNFGNCTDSVSKTIRVLPRPVANFSAPSTYQCQPPFTVNFQDLSATAVGWQWDFGDGVTSSQQNPSHTYNSYGNYDVTLIVTNPSGCTDTIKKTGFIKIEKAVIKIPSLPAEGCVPFTINPVANVTALDAVTSWLWDFGDGSTSTAQNPSHTYPNQGTYTVTLVITTSTGCTDTLRITNAVKAGTKPTPDFSAVPTPVCAYQPVKFTDQSSPTDQWLWNFGDGTTSTSHNPSHTYTNVGTFTVTLTAYNNGCPATISKPNLITVNPPIARFRTVPNCTNRLQFSFVDQSVGPVTWSWDFGDGTTSSQQNPVHNFPALGTYTVSLTVTNGSCSHSVTHTVHVINENPDFTASPLTLCKGTQTTFQVTGITAANIANYAWNTGDGIQNTSTPSYQHIYQTAGNYSVTLITTDINGCRDTASKPNYIRVNGPKASFTGTNTKGCQGLTVTFNDLSTTDGNNAITNWQWDFGDGTVQNLSAGPFTHTYTTAGTFSVKLTVTDASGCSDSLSRSNLVVASHPVANFKAADSLSCPGATVSFRNTSQSAFAYTAFWDFGNGSTSTATPNTSTIYNTTGDYTVKLRITDANGCSDSIIRNQYIHVDQPVASFTVSDSVSSCAPFEVHFTNTSQYYSSVVWTFGSDGNSTINNPVHYFGIPNTYPVSLVVTSHGGCKDTAFQTIQLYDTIGSTIKYAPLAGCNPLDVAFSAVTSGPGTYLWDYGDGNTESTTSPNVNHVYTTFGNFHPKIILQDPSGCLVPITGSDTIRIIGSNANFGLDKKLLCDSGLVYFTDSTTFNDPVTSWAWDFGDGTSSGQQNPVHQYTVPGIYTITLVTQTMAGCIDTARLTDALKVVQSPLISITGDSVACVFSPLTQQGISLRNDTSAVSWLWNFPNGATANSQNPPTQVYTTPGNFTITAIATNSSGCRDTANKGILVNPLPVIDLPGTMTILSGSSVQIPVTYSPNVSTWLWEPANGLSCTTCPQPAAGPKFNTTYIVNVVDSNSCRNSATIDVVVTCKDANIFIPNTFSPNGDGSNDVFYPRGTGLDRVKVLRIFNRWGEVVFEKINFPVNDPAQGWDGRFNGKDPQAGVYVYQVEIYCSNGDLIKFAGNVSLIQ